MSPSLKQFLYILMLVVGQKGERTPLYIGGFLPRTGTGFPIYQYARPAVDLALELINNSTEMLPDYELKLDEYDTGMSATLGMRGLLEMINGNTTKIFMIGPTTSAVSVHVCVAAASWNVVQVSFSTRSSALEDRELYPFFFRTIPSDSMLNPLRRRLLHHFRWSRVAIIYQKHAGELYYAGLPSLVAQLKADGIEVIRFHNIELNNFGNTIHTLKELDARIIFVHSFFVEMSQFFCEAYRQGFYGNKYVWILAGWAGSPLYMDNTDPVHNCTLQQLKTVLDGHLSVNYVSYADDSTSVLGMTVKKFRDAMKKNGTRVSEYSAYAFDAMITIGHVLDVASRDRGLNLSEFTYDSENFSAIFVDELQKLQTNGISGPVAFDDFGNRLGVSVAEQFQDGTRKQIGKMEPRSEVLDMDPTARIIWPGNQTPRDGPLRSRRARFLPLTSIIPISVLSAVGFVATCVFITFNWKFAHLKIIKLSSPNMNNVVALGCSLGYVSVVMFGLDGRQLQAANFGAMCHARLFVLCAAYSLTFGALFFKTWRVHRIMANKKLAKIKLKDRHLVAWILGLVVLDVLFLFIWVAVDPLQRTLAFLPNEVDPDDSDHILEPFIEKCTCQSQEYWLGAMLVYKGLLLLFGLFLAWETRNIQVQALNDSKYIGMSVYNLAIICVVGIPVGFIISDEYFVGKYIISSFFIIIAVTITLCFVFVPKLHAIYTNPSGEVDVRFPTQRLATATVSAGAGAEDISFTATTSRVAPVAQVAHNIAILHRLEKMVAERDNEIKELREELGHGSDLAIGAESVN